MNIHSEKGLKILIKNMALVKPSGLFLCSPNCATWVRASRGTTLRGLVPVLSWDFFSGLIVGSSWVCLRVGFEVYILCTMLYFLGDRTHYLLQWIRPKEIHGDCSNVKVILANAIARVLGEVLYPLAQWLLLGTVTEQPAARSCMDGFMVLLERLQVGWRNNCISDSC